MAPLKLIIRDGSLGTGTVAAAAAALAHIIGNSGANVDREPMWQDASLLEKLMFVAAGSIAAADALPVYVVIPCTGKVANAAVDEVAWCGAVLALLVRGSWMRTRLFMNPASLKDAVSMVCELSMGKFSQCMTNAVWAMTLLANLFEGSQDVQWSQCLVRSGAHRAAQAHIIAYGDHPVLIRAVGRMCTCICLDSACATLLRDLDLQ